MPAFWPRAAIDRGAADPMAKAPVARTDVSRFLAEVRKAPPARKAEHGAPHARILFALDATASREPTWDMATNLHAELFSATAGSGVAVQLAYYRGFNEFHASPWSTSPADLLAQMTGVRCRGGLTQIGRVLQHALDESRKRPVKAVVFVGDACEEDHDALAGRAGQLAVFNLPCFVFQEGADPVASRAFRDIAAITRGAHAPFAPGSAETLRALFGAVAAYAAQGRTGVAAIEHAAARRLLAQLP